MPMIWRDGDIDGVIIRSLVKHPDARGWLAEIFRSDEMPAEILPVMGYVSLTRPGVTRGPHEHRQQADTFAFVGPGKLEIRLWDQRPASPTRGNRKVLVAGEDNPLVITVPPGVAHSYTNVSAADCLVMNFPNRLYRGPGKKEPVDEIRYEDDSSGRFATGRETDRKGNA
jgi:dTDP-4-dehydrorhamnose 3,5-epimerase